VEENKILAPSFLMRITFFASFPAVGQKGRGFEREGIFARLLPALKTRLGPERLCWVGNRAERGLLLVFKNSC
jgi:hypothetical protein